MDFYSSVNAVKIRTGIDPADLGLDEDTDLTTFIEDLLKEVSDEMNRRMRRDWMADLAAGIVQNIPAGLNGIAADVAAGSIREMVATRQTPVVKIDDFAVKTISSRIFSPDVEKRLRVYSRAGLSTLDITLADIAGSEAVLTASDLDTMDD